MSLTREEYLAQCLVCSKRSFNPQKGIVCSLTKEHADFEVSKCPDFDEDSIAQNRKEAHDLNERIAEEDRSTFGLSAFGVKNQITASIIVILMMFVWLFVGLYYNLIFYYPIIIMILAFIGLGDGISKRTKKNKQKSNENVLDNEVF